MGHKIYFGGFLYPWAACETRLKVNSHHTFGKEGSLLDSKDILACLDYWAWSQGPTHQQHLKNLKKHFNGIDSISCVVILHIQFYVTLFS